MLMHTIACAASMPHGLRVTSRSSGGRIFVRPAFAVHAMIDARAPARFRGEQEPIDPVAGHIPNAVNLPVPDLVGEQGRFLAPDELRARFAAVGAESAASVGAYCGSGVAASYEVLALSLAGIPASLYVGSWSDWITDPDRPVATGG